MSENRANTINVLRTNKKLKLNICYEIQFAPHTHHVDSQHKQIHRK